LIGRLLYGDRVQMVNGDGEGRPLPEPVEICASELFGDTGGAKGFGARSGRVLDLPSTAEMFPAESVTAISAVELPENLRTRPVFDDAAADSLRRIFESAGYPFDLRVCVRNLPPQAVITNEAVFEHFIYTRPEEASDRRKIELIIAREAILCGFALTLRLGQSGQDGAGYCYASEAPVFIPVFMPGVKVTAGARIEATCRRSICMEDDLHFDYQIEGSLITNDGRRRTFFYRSPFHQRSLHGSDFYKRLRINGASLGDFWKLGSTRQMNGLIERLRSSLRSSLPEYMAPSAYLILEKLPLTINGKLDRDRLPAPKKRERREGENRSPRNPVEEIILGIWGQVLRVEDLGPDDDFFAVGGHSLLATQVLSRIRGALQVELPLRFVFEHRTIAELAEVVNQRLKENWSPLIMPPVAIEQGGLAPLSFAQQRLWLLDRLEPGSVAYHIPQALHLSGSLNVTALQRSLTEIVRRHQVLRTRFVVEHGEAWQEVLPIESAPVEWVDVSGESNPECAARELVEAEASRPFDLSLGPLFRVKLIRLGLEDHVLMINMHHLVSDGWSAGVFVRELTTLYGAFVMGQGSPLPELPLQYRDFAAWQRQWLTGNVLEAQLRYWREQLAGIPALDLPVDYPRPAVQMQRRGGRVAFSLPRELTEKLRELSRQEGATLFMTLLAAFQLLLGRYADQDDVAVGTPIANRNRKESEALIGFFVNTLVLRARLDGNPGFRGLLRRVREVCLVAYAHQDLPFEKLVNELAPERNVSRAPLFQVMLAVENIQPGQFTLPGISVRQWSIPVESAKFDLTMHLLDDQNSLHGQLEYDRDLFTEATIRLMAEHYQLVLQSVTASPDAPIAGIAIMTEDEARQLEEWGEMKA
jgi:hypothetical protein